ncbi:hypothetical protein F442_15901 [Phytophthora nicotianae P10297]|uniref:Uncharacterized protein n=1 Tax=Phytophthora nicotianae P10297 TaxID=1317064 RepID=W2YMA7_PHYNI|nr:hypothetical protein F442_15901 [Phytophthora nicotianae P10297]
MAVLGPDSINDAKFSGWSTQLQALGLIWDTTDRTVSMPAAKIHKCLDRVVHMLTCKKVTMKHLQKLLGSLRHLSTCLRSAKPFYQRLQALCSRLQVFQSIRLTPGSIRDLQWCQHILSDGHLERLPLRFFGSLPEADINIYMDASDTGLAVLHPARSEFILLKFDEEEALMIQNSDSTGFTINQPGVGVQSGIRIFIFHTWYAGAITCLPYHGLISFSQEVALVKKSTAPSAWQKQFFEFVSLPTIYRGRSIAWQTQDHARGRLLTHTRGRLLTHTRGQFCRPAGLRCRCPRTGGRFTKNSPRTAIQFTGRVITTTVSLLMEPVDTMVRVNGVQSVASRGPRSLVTATRLIHSVLLQIRQRFLVGPRKLTTDHPVQDQCSRVVSSLRVWSQYRPPSPPRDGNQWNPSAPAFAPTQATHYGVHPPHTPPTTQFPLSSRP